MFILLFVGLQGVWAQQKTVTGVVTSADDGLPIPGVSIVIKGTTIGTATDLDGKFSLTVDKGNEVLIFSFVGMVSQEIKVVDMKPNMKVKMQTESIGVNEVIVTAYGTSKKSSFTGSAAAVKSEVLQKAPVASFEKALAGNVSGLQISSPSGQPGAASQIRIRGIGSFSASQEPLYVIDGVPVVSRSMTTSLDSEDQNTSSVMSSINPADIESLTVLKDAAAASLYGSRAANGVIIITTKSGKKGKTKIDMKASYGISQIATDNFETVDGDTYVQMMIEGMENDGMSEDEIAKMVKERKIYKPEGGYADWDDALIRTAKTQNYELSVSGGNEKTTFYTSGSYFNQEGVVKSSQLERITLRLNMTHKINDKAKLGMNLSNAYTNQDRVLGGGYYANPWSNSRQFMIPTEPIKNTDGTYNTELHNGYYNIVNEQRLNDRNTEMYRTTVNSWFEYEIIENLKFKTTNNYDYVYANEMIYSSPSSRAGRDNRGEIAKVSRQNRRLTSSNILTYSYAFDEHNFNFLAGYEVEKEKYTYDYAGGVNLPNETLKVLDVASKPDAVAGYFSESSMLSYLSRVNYDFQNKYYASFSFRRDGGSKLGKNNQWANFWSVSGSWRLSEEDFMSNISFLDDLKLRASYGTNGTLPDENYGHMGLYSYDYKYNASPAARYTQVENPDLTWEQSKSFNLGVEFGVFQKLRGSFEFFNKKTEDLIMKVPISRTTGFNEILQNVGEMENKGFELELHSTNIQNNDLTWLSDFSISATKNEITKLNNGEDIFDFPYIRREGEAYNTFYLRDWAGVDPASGAALWHVVDADGKRTGEVTKDASNAGKAIVGKADPDFYGTLNNSLKYKGFDLSFMFAFSYGGQIYNHAAYGLMSDGNTTDYAIMEDQKDRWQKPGDVTKHPIRTFESNTKSNFNSSRRVLDNDYIRLKNVSLAYNLPSSILDKAKISSARVFVNGSNLWHTSTQDLVDPEQNINGSTSWEVPPVKTFTFGVQLSF